MNLGKPNRPFSLGIKPDCGIKPEQPIVQSKQPTVPKLKLNVPKQPIFQKADIGILRLREQQDRPDNSNLVKPTTLSLKSSDSPHIIVDALAGTGKTFTIIESAYRAVGFNRPGIVGSDEQEAIWDAISETYNPSSVCMLAFNSSIASELKNRVPPGVRDNTFTSHAFGKKCLAIAGVKGASRGKYGVTKKKSHYILADVLGVEFQAMWHKFKKAHLYYIQKLVGFCKANLIQFSGNLNEDIRTLKDLADIHGATAPKIDTVKDEEFVYVNAIEVYNRSHLKLDVIDFDDMIWLPWKLSLDIRPFDLLYVDERQDLNLAQQDLVLKAGRRLVLVGDVNQAIYGFAGADVSACSRMAETLVNSPRKCLQFPLTYTHRCGKKIVEYCQQIVPEFKYFPDAPEGKVSYSTESKFLDQVQQGDMVVCRTNAPLFTYCLKLMQQGRKFKTTCKDFFEDIIYLIKSFAATSMAELDTALEAWKEQQLDRCTGSRSEMSVIIEDKYQAIQYGMKVCTTPDQLLYRLREVFGSEEGDEDANRKPRQSPDSIYLTSIHQAKGLEENTVWWAQYDLVPHPKARIIEQERNLKWVASTRAINHLVLVKSEKTKGDEE